MSEQLKPCPFCTSDTEIRKPLGIDNQNDAIVIEEDNGLAAIESDSWGFLVRYCPMCGRPLSGTGNGVPGEGAGMSIQEAILSFYHDLRDLSELKIDDPIMYRDMGGDKEKDKMLTALAALRSQEEAEKSEPLTLEELLGIDGPTPLWDSGEYKPFWTLVEWIPVQGGGRKLHWVSLDGGEDFITENIVIEGYGTYWNYYHHKPKG